MTAATDVLQLFDQVNAALGVDLAVDWFLLAVQLLILAGIVAAEVVRRSDRCLPALIVAIAMLLLVQGQAWWTFEQLSGASYVQQLSHLITRDGARLANLYLAIATFALAAAYLLSRRRAPVARRAEAAAPAPAPVPYLLVTLWTAAASLLLLAIDGGPLALLRQPGTSVAGQTVALLALGLGKMPLLDGVAGRRRPSRYDFALFLWVFVLLLLNSRFLALFAVCQLVLLWDRRRQLPRTLLMGGAVFAAVVIVGYGLYRDLGGSTPTGTPLDALSIASFEREHTSNGIPDWLYARNVEGFSGPAGMLSATLLNGGLSHDLGLSELDTLTHLVPNAWRTNPDLPFFAVDQFAASVYPYDASIVRPGFELAYGHLGLPGMVLLGVALGVLPRRLHDWMHTARDPLPAGLLSVQVAQLVRSSVSGSMFYGLADIVALWLYRRMATVEANAREGRPPASGGGGPSTPADRHLLVPLAGERAPGDAARRADLDVDGT